MSSFQMPCQLRSLFATIHVCVHYALSSSKELWETHNDTIMEDYIHRHIISALAAEQRELKAIDAILQESSMSCSGLGEFDITLEETGAVTKMAKLNDEQCMLIDNVLQDLDEIRDGHPPRSLAYFLDGPGGSGKIMCYNIVISYYHSQVVKVASTSWTKIAATLL